MGCPELLKYTRAASFALGFRCSCSNLVECAKQEQGGFVSWFCALAVLGASTSSGFGFICENREGRAGLPSPSGSCFPFGSFSKQSPPSSLLWQPGAAVAECSRSSQSCALIQGCSWLCDSPELLQPLLGLSPGWPSTGDTARKVLGGGSQLTPQFAPLCSCSPVLSTQ